jgi:exodeoxyribonuclease V
VASAIRSEFPYEPTEGQNALIAALADFVCTPANNSLFIIRGYAGTGKTTMVSALVRVLPKMHIGCILLAPTGRAAKVLAAYSGRQAFTIHKKIYRVAGSDESGMKLMPLRNLHKDTIFIVDEASMISDSTVNGDYGLFGNNCLLGDLFTFVNGGQNCRLIFIGDSAQLPPVGISESPALDSKYLKTAYQINPSAVELTEVVRQSAGSGILFHATEIRHKINSKKVKTPFFSNRVFKDVNRISGAELEDVLHTAYSAVGPESIVTVCRSNKSANLFNREIRGRILGFDAELCAGDILIAARNNYFWLPEESEVGFIANGDSMEVLRVRKIQELYGYRFADVQVRFMDFPGQNDCEIRIILDSLHLDTAAFSSAENRRFFDAVMMDYTDIPSKAQRIREVRNNPFFNAVQVKYAYALTCHKAQGGQWDYVFVDQGYLNDDMIDYAYARWLYTAVTRATTKLFLVNFNENFFEAQ